MGKKIGFFITCTGILLPLICLCLYARFDKMAFVDGEAPFYIWNRDKTNNTQSKGCDVIILGDSVANAGYIPALLTDKCLNLAMGGTTAMENYYTMSDWLENNPAPKVCYISFMDFHFQREDCFWTRSTYTHRYTLAQSIAMMKSAVQYQEPSVLTEHYWEDLFGYELGLPDKYMTAIVNARFDRRREANRSAYKINELRGGLHSTGTGEYKNTDPVNYNHFTVKPMFDEYYRKLIKLCLDNGITVRIIKMPLPNNSVFTEDYKEEFSHYYDAIKALSPEGKVTVDWLDLYERDRFQDPVHMNYHGALQFSEEVRRLYPEDFDGETTSSDQIAAINYYMGMELKVEELLKWINGRDYSIAIWDGTGEFDQFYWDKKSSECYVEAVEMLPFDGQNPDTGQWYCISGKSDVEPLSMIWTEDGTMIDLGNGKSWTCTEEGDRLDVVVIDQYNSEFVYNRSFEYIDGQYIAMK